MLLKGGLRNDIFIEKYRRMISRLHFAREISSCDCLVGSGLKFIFRWNAHSPIFFNSLFRSIFEASTFLTTEKNEVLSVNNVGYDVKFSDKLLI